MLKKKINSRGGALRSSAVVAVANPNTVDRRGFLRASGLAAGGISAVAAFGVGRVQKAEAADAVIPVEKLSGKRHALSVAVPKRKHILVGNRGPLVMSVVERGIDADVGDGSTYQLRQGGEEFSAS